MNPDLNTAYQFVLNEHSAALHRLAVSAAVASALSSALKAAEAQIADLKDEIAALKAPAEGEDA